jgi:hypothetical protein
VIISPEAPWNGSKRRNLITETYYPLYMTIR